MSWVQLGFAAAVAIPLDVIAAMIFWPTGSAEEVVAAGE